MGPLQRQANAEHESGEFVEGGSFLGFCFKYVSTYLALFYSPKIIVTCVCVCYVINLLLGLVILYLVFRPLPVRIWLLSRTYM